VRHLDPGVLLLAVSRPHHASCRDLLAQWRLQRGGQHHHPVLVALGLAHHDHLPLEVDVLDAQPQALHQPHARAVQQARHQGHRAFELAQHLRHFAGTQDSGDAPRRRRPLQLLHPRQLNPEHLAVEEQQRAERLLVGGRGDATLGGQHGEERLDLGRPQIARVPQPAPADEEPYPVHVSLLRLQAEVPVPQPLDHLLQQARR
jgi:hypothetical protein